MDEGWTLISDFDGCLFSNSMPEDERAHVLTVLESIRHAGHTIIIASGRRPCAVAPELTPFLNIVDAFIFGNGAVIKIGEDVIVQNILPSKLRILCRHLDAIDSNYYVDSLTFTKSRFLRSKTGNWDRDDASVFSVRVALKNIEEMARAINLSSSLGLDVIFWANGDVGILEFMERGVNKYSAAKRVIDILHKENRAVIAVGNDYNDLPMLLHADLSICVGNVPEEVKMASNVRAGTILELVNELSRLIEKGVWKNDKWVEFN
ncbi:MAG: Cof-type HAD-IIB family hydrolase [Thermoflavifilum sp.]|nr:Cof-type HAD-IIB family hydrolase [Thermoflavifilum sp.]